MLESSEQPGGDTGSAPARSGGASGDSPSPSSSGSSTTRISASDFERAASAGRTPSQPGATEVPAADPTKAPVEYSRFAEINDKYGKVRWAESLQPEQTQAAVQLYNWLDTDPRGAGEYILQQLRNAGILPAESPAAPTPKSADALLDERGRPLPDLVVEGTGQRLYSAEQAQRLADWNLAQLQNELKPIKEERQRAQVIQSARTEANRMVAQAAQNWPHFSDHMTEIDAELAKDPALSLHEAYIRVVIPKLEETHRRQFVEDVRTRANGSTHNPGSPAPSSSTDLRKLSLRTLLQREAQRRGIGR
jgi:hypothetical protein